MIKERLEELKKMRLLYEVCFVDEYASAIDDVTVDFDLLIKRVQELEETNKKNYWIASDFKFENLKLEQQNKRYREALEFINEELELVLHSNKGLAEKMFYIENSKRKITEVLESESNE